MYNLYTSSTVSLRSRSSLSFSLNDHPSYFHPTYNARYPSSNSSSCCCNCNCCSSAPVNCVTSSRVVPINPSLTFGFRQTTLIQWPSSRRRLILTGVDRCGYGDPVGNLGGTRISYGRICCIRDAGADGFREEDKKSKAKRIGLWGYKEKVFEESLVSRNIGSACEDAEAMISLLTEEVGQELLDVRENACLYRNGKSNENAVKGKSKFRNRNELRLSKQGSIGSSYYSCSDSGVEVETDQEYVEEGVMGNEESRKRFGGRVVSQRLNEEPERHKIKQGQNLGSSRKGDKEVGSSENWDQRKKYTKKLTEDSFKEIASRKNSIFDESRRPEARVNGFEKASKMKKQYSFRGEESVSVMNSSEDLRSGYNQTENRVSGTSDSRYTCCRKTGSSGHVYEKSTGSSKKVILREENVVSSCQFCATCGQVSSGNQKRSNPEQRPKTSLIQENNINLVLNRDAGTESRHKRMKERSSLLQMSTNEVNNLQEHHTAASGQINTQSYTERADDAETYEENTNLFRGRDIISMAQHQDTDTRLASTTKKQSDSRINRLEETSTSLQTSLEDINEKIHGESLVPTSQPNLTRKSQNCNIADVGVSYVQNTSRTRKEEEARMKFPEENLVAKINISSQHAKGGQYQTVTEFHNQNQYIIAPQDVSGGSQVRIHKTMTRNSQSASLKKSHSEQSYLTERVKLEEQRIETCEQVKERVKQTDIRYELQPEASLHEKETSNEHRTSTSQIRIQEISDNHYEKNLLSGWSPRLAPPAQSIERDPVYAESASRFTRGNSSQSSEGDTGIYIYPQATAVPPTGQASGTYEEPSQLISPVDLLGSAERQDRSSLQVIGDFVDKARHEASTSVTQMEKKLSERHLVNEGASVTHEDSSQSDHESLELRKRYSRHSSDSGKTKVPAEEMWGSQDPCPQEEASQTAAAPVSVMAERSGRTLWNVLADVARFRWGPRAESNKSPVKSGGQSSSSDSLSSEAWFSGHDPDEVKAGDMKRSTSSRLPESSSADRPLLIRTPTQSSSEQFTLANTSDDARPTVDDAPSFPSGGISGETNLELNVEVESSQATTSANWSQPAAGLFRRSHRRSYATIELQEGGKEVIGTGVVDEIKDDADLTLTEVSGSGENAIELERRKLLRNKQVVRERFEEWEEAYQMEIEQRRMDEFFMREALEEAKKAADMWEVPVGAVLVHEGKIIARGYNLVEDLRDSTAHAEMICIREASNVLKAWRLSDTKLYVTLEPCAMCAGAILQARIGTLVYGAPNKLLGADGSWIRLFPSSSAVGGCSESTGNTEGPVHPFHPNMTIRRGILETECADAMQKFFRLRRKKDKKTEQADEQQISKKLLHPSKLLNKMHHVFHFLFCL